MGKRGWLCVLIICVCLLTGCAEPAKDAAGQSPRGLLIWIDLDLKRLTVYENGQSIAVFPIASGAKNTPSPVGVFKITHRFSTQLSGFGTRFLGLNVPWGQYGIHGTNKPSSIGQNASHGCIRLSVGDAEKLYAMIPNGTKVVIQGGPYGALSSGLRALQEGDRGADVFLLQQQLIRQGFLSGAADGIFGSSTRLAVLAAARHFSLPESDRVSYALWQALGVTLFE